MSKVVRVSDGDYKVITKLDGTITLDTGNQIGRVIVTGDLIVEGNTTTIESETLTVKDNIIYINEGETGSGVTLGTAGLTIERGTLADASLIFDESISYTTPTAEVRQGVFKFIDSADYLVGLNVNSILTNGGDLSINTGVTGSGVISVSSVPDYENRVTDDDDIPNKKYVDNYVLALIAVAPIQGFRRFSGTTPLDTFGFAYDTEAGDPESKIEFQVDGVVRSVWNAQGLNIDALSIRDNYIKTNISNANLELKPNGTGSVQVESSVALVNLGSTPSSSAGQNKIYSSATQGPGATGIYFTNTLTADELVSRRRSLVFSMIF